MNTIRNLSVLMILAMLFGFVGASDVSAAPGDIEWVRQFGTSGTEFARVAVDASGTYVVGQTDGTLPGQTSAGLQDAYIRKYDAAGVELWTRQFGTPANDGVFAVVTTPPTDSVSGVYVVGQTGGTLPGQTSSGLHDAFIRKYDVDGNILWTRQFGSQDLPDWAKNDNATRVAADATGVYVSGYTDGKFPGQTVFGNFDSFVRKYDFAGNELWTDQFGTNNVDWANGLVADGLSLYVVGATFGTFPGETNLGGYDAYIRKYAADGTVLWTDQFGTAQWDYLNGVAVDASGLYVTGQTQGALPGQASSGNFDAFVRKYDVDGMELWTHQFGTPGQDQTTWMAADASGVIVVGDTESILPGQTSTGGIDIFVRKYDSAGAEVWTKQFGTSSHDYAYGLAVGPAGLYVAGATLGTFTGQTSSGGQDSFVVKLGNDIVNELPTAVAAGPYLVAVNESIGFDGSGSFDLDEGDILTEEWTADGGTVSGNTYTAGNVPGVYEVCLTVNDGTVDSEPSCTMVVIYNPDGGFVTGGGWIDSPAGAYKPDESLSGKANFGFVARYKKGANVPDGNTQFKFKAGNLDFDSTSYEWLVVAGSKAQFKGEGAINGEAGYTFMIWANDDNPDTFRIHIWGDSGTVYDNGSQQALGGGSIKIHSGNANAASVTAESVPQAPAAQQLQLFLPLVSTK